MLGSCFRALTFSKERFAFTSRTSSDSEADLFSRAVEYCLQKVVLMSSVVPLVHLRAVTDEDLPIFFEHQQDVGAVLMAAFTHEDRSREAFDRHWAKIRSLDSVLVRTALFEDEVVGHIASFEMDGGRDITYWFDRKVWGRGIATAALASFLETVDTSRPLGARTAHDNLASIRVLEKCGFTVTGKGRYMAHARGEEIDEMILELK